MTIGFTGTQQGMTNSQKRMVLCLMHELKPSIVHHGCCVGADAEFHHIADLLDLHIVMHPPADRKKMALMPEPGLRYTMLPELPYLERNHAIVDSCDLLIATPMQAYEKTRSGTWATVRYARGKNKPRRIVLPSGLTLADLETS